MAYNSISIKPYIKSHLELQREITLIKLAPSPYFFVLSICLAYMNMFASIDENPAMTLQDIKETKRYRQTHTRMDNVKTVYPATNKVCGGYNNRVFFVTQSMHYRPEILNFKCSTFIFNKGKLINTFRK